MKDMDNIDKFFEEQDGEDQWEKVEELGRKINKTKTWKNQWTVFIPKSDQVNSPAHYTRGSQEAIVTIEEAIADAPEPVAGMLHAQVLKYLLRVWIKENDVQDLKKAQWYLNRLIDHLDQ